MKKNKLQEDLCKEYGITEKDILKRIKENKPIFEKGNCVIKKYWRLIACEELLDKAVSIKVKELKRRKSQ